MRPVRAVCGAGPPFALWTTGGRLAVSGLVGQARATLADRAVEAASVPLVGAMAPVIARPREPRPIARAWVTFRSVHAQTDRDLCNRLLDCSPFSALEVCSAGELDLPPTTRGAKRPRAAARRRQ